jgi:hypothetical protein
MQDDVVPVTRRHSRRLAVGEPPDGRTLLPAKERFVPLQELQRTKSDSLTQAGNGSVASLSRGDLAGRLETTVYPCLKRQR